MRRFVTLCILLLGLFLSSAAQAQCGGQGQFTCFGYCNPGLAPDPANAYLTCTACGGHNEPLCYGVCESWHILNPLNPLYCTRCGGQDELTCLGICKSGLLPDPDNFLLTCAECGGQDQYSCLGFCDPGLALNPANILKCTWCGGQDEPLCQDLTCDTWYTPKLTNLLQCTACGSGGQPPCDPLLPWVPNCRDGYEVWLSLNCEQCGVTLGPACTPGPACLPRHTQATNLVDIFGIGVTEIIDQLDFLDVIPNVCIPCGESGLPVCPDPPACDQFSRDFLGFCQHTGFAAEPTTNSTVSVPQQTAGQPVWGWADVHEHQFGNDAYGGAVLWGKPFDPQGINSALAWCDYTWDFKTEFTTIDPNVDNALLEGLANLDGRGYPIHGSHKGLIPSQWVFGFNVNQATNIPLGLHDVTGLKGEIPLTIDALEDYLTINPARDPWPIYEEGGHQQMYYKWLERAYQGGLRLLVNMPVNNEILCTLSLQREGWSCDDMDSVEEQIKSIEGLRDFVDYQNDGMINGNGWYRIAYSPQQAREIIEEGAMAVVLSIEVDSLFGCKPGTENTECTEQKVIEKLEALYARGVRHVYPVHLFDNAFAGAAYYGDFFAIANTLATGGLFEPYDCSIEQEAYSFKYDFLGSQLWNTLLIPMASTYGATIDIPAFVNFLNSLNPNRGADCNSKGLSSRGEFLLRALMAKGVMIDIDHFSRRALLGYLPEGATERVDGALDILDENNYPPVSSHTVVMPDIDQVPDYEPAEAARSEFGFTASLAREVAKRGGLIAINPARDTHKPSYEVGTTKTFVHGMHRQFQDSNGVNTFKELRTLGYNDIIVLIRQAYIDHNTEKGLTQGQDGWLDPDYPRTGWAGDFGAFVPQPSPRFTWTDNDYRSICAAATPEEIPPTCTSYISGDETPLSYPFDAFELVDKTDPSQGVTGTFDKQVTGVHSFDFNTDGLAHIGLLPDMLADAKVNYGADLTPFFNSAEAFIRLWEQVYVDNGIIDLDGDGIADVEDNCTSDSNPSQTDTDDDGAGDACDVDDDEDGVNDDQDNCPLDANAGQADWDEDGGGDACDFDDDNDTIDDLDDICPFDHLNDADGDGVCGNLDVCTGFDDNLDADEDGVADGCDVCANDPDNDSDGDGVCGDEDTCPGFDDRTDTDGDGLADGCDSCPIDPDNDADEDGVCGNLDACPGFNDSLDADEDTLPDACDVCPNDNLNDGDSDGLCADVDNCPVTSNPDQLDFDGDDLGDACDAVDDETVFGCGFEAITT